MSEDRPINIKILLLPEVTTALFDMCHEIGVEIQVTISNDEGNNLVEIDYNELTTEQFYQIVTFLRHSQSLDIIDGIKKVREEQVEPYVRIKLPGE